MGIDALETENDYISLSNRMHDVGYDSVLFIYHSKTWDNWILATRSINKSHSFKYMFAIRTYAISPEYCSMMCRAFDKIDSNRLKLNIVAGDLHKEENSLDNIVDIKSHIDTMEKRIDYTGKWLDKFVNIKWESKIPDLVVSGYSSGACDNASTYAQEQLMMLGTYKEIDKSKIKCDGIIVSVPIIIDDYYDKAKKRFEDKYPDRDMMKKSVVMGSQEQVVEEILKLQDIGVTNVMLTPIFSEDLSKIDATAKKIINILNN